MLSVFESKYKSEAVEKPARQFGHALQVLNITLSLSSEQK